jgi:hypothetical protein
MPPPPGYDTFKELCRRAGVCGNTARRVFKAMEQDGTPITPFQFEGTRLFTTAQSNQVRAYYKAHGGRHPQKSLR